MTKRLGPAAVLATLGALAAAALVLWFPTRPGEVITGTGLAAVLAWWLGKHRHAKRGLEAGLAGALGATLLLVFAAAAVPLAVGLVMIAPAAAHELNPKRKRVARTTRGVKAPAGKASGGRAGRPGEKPHAARPARPSRPAAPRTAPSRPRLPASPQKPAESRAPAIPPAPPAWPRTDPMGRLPRYAVLPDAGEGTGTQYLPPAPDAPAAPGQVRKTAARPTALHRRLCGECAAGECARCPGAGCECPAEIHIPF